MTGQAKLFLGAALCLALGRGHAVAATLVSVGQPLVVHGLEGADNRQQDVRCLADAVYYEAANQPLEGRRAVAQVVLNRLKNPHYPKSVCGVVYQGATRSGCQFTFACDGSLSRTPSATARRDAETVAEEALDGTWSATVGGSTHYHTTSVHPYWSASLTPTVRIGVHQFYSSARGGGVFVDHGRAAPALGGDLLAASPAQPQASRFSVWGLEVAQISPLAGGVAVTGSGPAP